MRCDRWDVKVGRAWPRVTSAPVRRAPHPVSAADGPVAGTERTRPCPPDRRRRTRPPGEVPGGRGAGPEPTEPPDGLSALLAALGAHLERHSPAGVAVLLRSELERREFLAYANGWRDAADRDEPAPEQARRIAGSRRLRLVGSTPGRPAVIPFRQDAPASAADEGAPAATPAPARRAPEWAWQSGRSGSPRRAGRRRRTGAPRDRRRTRTPGRPRRSGAVRRTAGPRTGGEEPELQGADHPAAGRAPARPPRPPGPGAACGARRTRRTSRLGAAPADGSETVWAWLRQGARAPLPGRLVRRNRAGPDPPPAGRRAPSAVVGGPGVPGWTAFVLTQVREVGTLKPCAWGVPGLRCVSSTASRARQ